MTGVDDIALGHRLERAGLVHPAQSLVAQPRGFGLDRVDAALGQVQGHRPVVGDRVDDPGEARVDRGLGGPDVGRHVGLVLGQILQQIRHQLGAGLVVGVVAELAEALGVQRLPVKLVEQLGFLAQTGAHRVELVLAADDAGAGRAVKGIEIQPDRLVAQGLCAGGHRHRDAVVAEAHADVPDEDRFVGKLRAFSERQNLRAEGGEDGVVGQREAVVLSAVVAVLLRKLLLGFLRLPDDLIRHQIAENFLRFL